MTRHRRKRGLRAERLRRQIAGSRRRNPPGTVPGTLTPDPEALPPQLHVIAYGPDDFIEVHDPDVEDLQRLNERYPVLWLNVDGLGDPELIRRIGRIFGLHVLALEDVVHVYQRPKFDSYDEHEFVVLRMATREEGLHLEQISVFFGEGFVLSFQERPGDVLGPVRERIRRASGRIRRRGPDYLAYAVIDAVVDGYFPLLEAVGDELEQLEEAIMERADNESMRRLMEARRELLLIRRVLWPQRELMRQLTMLDRDTILEDTRTFFNDVRDHAAQLVDLAESLREVVAGLMELHAAMVSNRMNEVMKVLTIIATIFMPLTFVAGLYGMNFDPEASPWNMPELSWYWGYPVTLATMAILAAGMLVYFRRKGWL